MTEGSLTTIAHPTNQQRRFVERYIPFLEDMLGDPDKLRWCEDYMRDNSARQLHLERPTDLAEDRWGLERTIYDSLMRDALAMGMVPENYLDVFHGIKDENGELKPFEELTDEELVCLVALTIRSERFVENSLLFAAMDGTLLRYLKELQRRWSE